MQNFAKTYMPNVCQSVRRNFFQKMAFFSKWLKTMLTRQISLLRSICRQYCAQIFFLSMIHVETRSQYQVCFILGMYVGRLVGRHLYVSWRGPYFNKKYLRAPPSYATEPIESMDPLLSFRQVSNSLKQVSIHFRQVRICIHF